MLETTDERAGMPAVSATEGRPPGSAGTQRRRAGRPSAAVLDKAEQAQQLAAGHFRQAFDAVRRA